MHDEDEDAWAREGRLACRFYKDGEWIEVPVDTKIPMKLKEKHHFWRSGRNPWSRICWTEQYFTRFRERKTTLLDVKLLKHRPWRRLHCTQKAMKNRLRKNDIKLPT